MTNETNETEQETPELKLRRVLKTPIADMEYHGMDLRTINALERHCGLYIETVLMKKREDLMEFPGMGQIMVENVVYILRKFLMSEGIMC